MMMMIIIIINMHFIFHMHFCFDTGFGAILIGETLFYADDAIFGFSPLVLCILPREKQSYY